jgi:hypothetical protein
MGRRVCHKRGGALRVASGARRTAPRRRAHHASTSARKAALMRRERAAPGPNRAHAVRRAASRLPGRAERGRHDHAGPGPRAPCQVPRSRCAGTTSRAGGTARTEGRVGASHAPCRAPWPRAGTPGQGPRADRATSRAPWLQAHCAGHGQGPGPCQARRDRHGGDAQGGG